MINPDIHNRENLKYIGIDELQEIEFLMMMWGIKWKFHTSNELIRLYDCEVERQKMVPLRQFA